MCLRRGGCKLDMLRAFSGMTKATTMKINVVKDALQRTDSPLKDLVATLLLRTKGLFSCIHRILLLYEFSPKVVSRQLFNSCQIPCIVPHLKLNTHYQTWSLRWNQCNAASHSRRSATSLGYHCVLRATRDQTHVHSRRIRLREVPSIVNHPHCGVSSDVRHP